MSADPGATDWLTRLAERLPRQADVLTRLRDAVRQDPRVVQLSVGCSLVRGNADELSDIDCELSLEPDTWPASLELVEPLVRSAGDVVELLHHEWPRGTGATQRRTAVQYANGVQLDLMAWPASVWSGMRPPDTVVLHATRELYTQPWDPQRAAPAMRQLDEWRFLAWWALLDADKYALRGSPWEARQRIEEARGHVWRLIAAAHGVPSPEHGVTSLLDTAGVTLPADMEATVPGLDISSLRQAIRQCAERLRAVSPAAARRLAPDAPSAPDALGAWAAARLRASATA